MSEGPLVSALELSAEWGDSALLVVDCRKDLADPAAASLAFAQGHIPGAIFADLDRDLADLDKPGQGRHPLPDAQAFSRTLSRWGWTPGTRVVAYDDAGGALAAARLWWMLRAVGTRSVRVLDGGLSAWRRHGFSVATDRVERSPSAADVAFDDTEMIGYDALENGLRAGDLVLIDARASPRFRGDVEPLDHVAGHVPGALNRPFANNLGVDGTFKSSASLHAEFRALIGARPPAEVVHMCGSGVTACHNLLAMEHAGLPGSRLFVPSWSGWSSEPARPVALGDA